MVHRACAPSIVCEISDVQCFFAGRTPWADLVHRGQHDPRIAVTGEVPTMTPYWQRSTICILPLQVGGGSRFKALEAMAYGIPIVSTDWVWRVSTRAKVRTICALMTRHHSPRPYAPAEQPIIA